MRTEQIEAEVFAAVLEAMGNPPHARRPGLLALPMRASVPGGPARGVWHALDGSPAEAIPALMIGTLRVEPDAACPDVADVVLFDRWSCSGDDLTAELFAACGLPVPDACGVGTPPAAVVWSVHASEAVEVAAWLGRWIADGDSVCPVPALLDLGETGGGGPVILRHATLRADRARKAARFGGEG